MTSSEHPDHLDRHLREWEFLPGEIRARMIKGDDGRDVLQTRVELGILQMEATARPDGERPGDQPTYLDFLISEEFHRGNSFTLSEDECLEVDREFLQYYQRRICWLTLKKYERAVADADHTLSLMDVVMRHSPNEEWTLAHEQYRPFVIFHRTHAAALAEAEKNNAEAAIGAINGGLTQLEGFFDEHDARERFDEDEMVVRLKELRESMREQFEVGKTLNEQLADAVAAEQFELAAQLRDEIRKKQGQL